MMKRKQIIIIQSLMNCSHHCDSKGLCSAMIDPKGGGGVDIDHLTYDKIEKILFLKNVPF